MSKKIIPALLLACSGFLIPAHAATLTGSASFTGTEATMTPRFFRGGFATTTCSDFSSGVFQYQSINFTSDPSGTLTASVDPGTCGVNAFVTFHSNSFDPANICTNHVWNPGLSGGFTGESFSVPPNTPMKMIISATNNFVAPTLNCGPMTYTLAGTGTEIQTFSENIASAVGAVNALMQPAIMGPAQKSILLNLLGLAARYQGPPYQSLGLSVLNAAILRVDGCALRGTPDTVVTQGGAGMDFVTSCPAQASVYPFLKAAQKQLIGPL